jgi:hypothetical protein
MKVPLNNASLTNPRRALRQTHAHKESTNNTHWKRPADLIRKLQKEFYTRSNSSTLILGYSAFISDN